MYSRYVTVSEERVRVPKTTGHLSSLSGEGTRSEALAWLAGRLRWEDELARLEQPAPAERPDQSALSARAQAPDAA
jgi:hypothetical protein